MLTKSSCKFADFEAALLTARLGNMSEMNDLDECYNIVEELVLHAGKVCIFKRRNALMISERCEGMR